MEEGNRISRVLYGGENVSGCRFLFLYICLIFLVISRLFFFGLSFEVFLIILYDDRV
jgi:hypothetical protein